MRHAGEIDVNRFAADILAQRKGELGFGVAELICLEQLTQEHSFTPRIRELYADRIATGNNRDTG